MRILKAQVNLINMQDALVRTLIHIARTGVGKHKERSTSRACYKFRKSLATLGFNLREVEQITQDAKDMARLELIADAA